MRDTVQLKSRTAESRQTDEAHAELANDLMVVWPVVVDRLEGGCSDLVDQFFQFEKLERSACVFCILHKLVISFPF